MKNCAGKNEEKINRNEKCVSEFDVRSLKKEGSEKCC